MTTNKAANLEEIQETNYSSLIAPILSITIMVLGMGGLTTFTTLRMHDFNTPQWLIGLVSTSYFIGLTIGGYKAQHLVLRVGHIRTFAASSAVFAVTALLQGLIEYPTLWILLRLIAGFCLAGCFLVIESWLLGGSTRSNRGIILAIYMISYYAGQAIGQFILSIPKIEPLEIYLICAIFFAFSLVPVAMTRFHAPYAEEPSILSFVTLNKKVPIAIWGAFCAGFVLAVLYSLYPLYLAHTNWNQGDVAICMAVLLFGATLAQYPVGWISDRCDRRIVISAVVIGCILMFMIIGFHHTNYYSLLIYSFLLGAFAFTLYPLSINHGIDHFTSKDLISATAAIMLAYGLGSILGPTLVSVAMHYIGIYGFIVVPSITSLLFLSFVIYRLSYVKSLPAEEKSSSVPLPGTTFEVVQMDLEVKEKDIDARHVDSLDAEKE